MNGCGLVHRVLVKAIKRVRKTSYVGSLLCGNRNVLCSSDMPTCLIFSLLETGATQQIAEFIATLGCQRWWAWPGATRQVAEPIAARGCPRKCYEWTWLGTTRQTAESIAAGRLGHPRYYEWMWPGAARQRLWNLMPLGGARGDVMNGPGLV